jgi:cytoskeleton protein RodZ
MTQNAPSGFGPGSRLAQAREDRALSVEEVARALRLSPRHIQALEADDYENLPGPTYVRGYLRSYAQFLELPPEEIVAAYNALSVAQQPVDLGRLAPPEQVTSDHGVVRLVTALVLGLFIVLAVAWWYGQKQPARILTPPPGPASGDVGGLSGVPSDTSATGADAMQAAAQREKEAGSGSPMAPAGKPRAETSAPVAGPAAGRTPAAGSPPATSPPPVTVAAAAGAARARLLLETREESWVDVRDAAGNRLLYETVPAGRTVSVEGEPPLSVFLGNVDGVRVSFNGQPYDAGRHRRGPIARFTLGAETARP